MADFKVSSKKASERSFSPKKRNSGRPDPKKDRSGMPDMKKDRSGMPGPKKDYSGRHDPKKDRSGIPDPKKEYRGMPRFEKGVDKRADKPIMYNNTAVEVQETENVGADRLEGRNPILEALKAGRTFNKILIAKGEREGSIKQIIAMARENGIVIQEIDRRNLDAISLTKSHQGIIAYVSVKEYVEVDDIIKVARSKGEHPFIVILDEIADANNFGSILRTADAVGVHGVIIPKRRAVGLTPTVAKASAGAIEYVPVARVSNLAQTIEHLKKENIWVVGTDETAEKDFYNSDLKGPIALVIGSEGEGMGRLIREKCDFVVNIPMKGSISSLNAAVAGAVVMFEIMKQRSR